MRLILSDLLKKYLSCEKQYSLVMKLLSKFEEEAKQIDLSLPFHKKSTLITKKQTTLPLKSKSSQNAKQQGESKKKIEKPPVPLQVKPLSPEEVTMLTATIRQMNRQQLMGILEIMKNCKDC